jgi:hypothetical protein
MICTPHQTYFGGQIKEWIGAACGIWGRDKTHTGIWSGKRRKETIFKI